MMIKSCWVEDMRERLERQSLVLNIDFDER